MLPKINSGLLSSFRDLKCFIYLFSFVFSLMFFFNAQAAKSEPVDILLLMHNPSGIRIEFNISKQKLELWISPQAGKDKGYWMRNFSNRDDYTRLFDNIYFPKLNPTDYIKTEYNPWHSVVHYKSQKLHIATVFDKPYLMLWFENESMVDFKSDKQDSIVKCNKNVFHIYHPDRGLDFSFVAYTNEGEFLHQLQTDKGRSIFTRVYLNKNNPLYIGGELSSEPVEKLLSDVSKITIGEQLENTQKEVDKILEQGRIVFRNHDSLQNLIDFNKRIWLSSQDHSGALHASIKYIYYLIWVREGGLACPWISYSGWLYPLEKWIDFQMHNPTEIHDEGPGGRFFGQLVNGKITKWQEDGAFYVIWSAFTHWTQSGKNTYVSGSNLKLLQESMQWLEKYCYDSTKGLFTRFYYCETPLHNSRDFGWDNAVGKSVLGWDPAPYKGHKLEKSYDIYINMLNYSAYKMLEAMCNVENVKNDYAIKATSLADKMKFMFAVDSLPLYGEMITTEGKSVLAEKYEIDETDYIWALTCPPFYPSFVDIDKYRILLFNDLISRRDDYFLAAYFSIIGSLDLSLVNQADVMKAIDYAAKECYIPWENLPMAGSMVEMSGYYPPGSSHQIRPQMFTMGAWFGAMGNLAVKRLPYGLSLHPSQILNGIEKYSYQDKLIDFSFTGEGNALSYTINGEQIKGSLQIPEAKLSSGMNKIDVKVSNEKNQNPLLISSTMKLISIAHEAKKINYIFEGFNASNAFTVVINNGIKSIQIKNAEGRVIKFQSMQVGENKYQISFSGTGKFIVALN